MCIRDSYHSHYDTTSKENLLAYKGYLMEFYKPKTVNLRIQAINKYLVYLCLLYTSDSSRCTPCSACRLCPKPAYRL